jgi:hypothetical protein
MFLLLFGKPFNQIQGGDTDFTGQVLTLWANGSRANAIGCHSPLGLLEVPEQLAVRGICVGISCWRLLEKLGAGIDDIKFASSNWWTKNFL